MFIKPVIGVLVALGTGLVLFASGKAKAEQGGSSGGGGSSKGGSSHPETKSKKDPRSIEQRVADALATEDPSIMVRVADLLDAEGFHDAAVSLRAEAERQRAGAAPPADPKPTSSAGQPTTKPTTRPTTTTRPPATRPTSTTRPPATQPPATRPPAAERPTEVLPEEVIRAEDPRRVAAQAVTQHLQALGGLAGRGHESKEIVKDYQRSEGLANPDGLYGPSTSMSILERHGIIPVAPYWWNKTSWKQQKAVYVDRVRKIATGDPQRAAQYEQLIKDTIRS